MDTTVDAPSAEAIIEAHLKLCDEVYQLLLEEQSLIRESQMLPDEAFLNKKKNLLPKLNASLASLKAIAKVPQSLKAKVAVGQQKLMKLLHLIRENERAILNVQAIQVAQPSHHKDIKPVQPQALRAYRQAASTHL